MAGTDGDGECVDAGLRDEVERLVRIDQKLFAGQLALKTVAVLLLAGARFQVAETTEFNFDGHAGRMGDLHDLRRDVDIVFVAGDRLAVGEQRTIHHDGGEAVCDGRDAGGRLVAVVEMQADRDMRIFFRDNP